MTPTWAFAASLFLWRRLLSWGLEICCGLAHIFHKYTTAQRESTAQWQHAVRSVTAVTVTADGWCWRSPEWDSKFRACSYLLLFQCSVMHDLFCLSKQIIFISGVRQLSVWHPLRGYLEHVLARCDARAWINKCCHIHFVYYDLYSASSKLLLNLLWGAFGENGEE